MESYIVLILIILTSATVVISIMYLSKNFYFICPKCNQRLKIPAKKLLITAHVFDEYNLRCPFCGEKNYMKQIREK